MHIMLETCGQVMDVRPVREAVDVMDGILADVVFSDYIGHDDVRVTVILCKSFSESYVGQLVGSRAQDVVRRE